MLNETQRNIGVRVDFFIQRTYNLFLQSLTLKVESI